MGFFFRFHLFASFEMKSLFILMVSESQQPSEKDVSVKLKQLQYLLVKALPVLRDVYAEQNRELEVEAAVRGMFSSLVFALLCLPLTDLTCLILLGIPVTESDITWSELHPSERIYW